MPSSFEDARVEKTLYKKHLQACDVMLGLKKEQMALTSSVSGVKLSERQLVGGARAAPEIAATLAMKSAPSGQFSEQLGTSGT